MLIDFGILWNTAFLGPFRPVDKSSRKYPPGSTTRMKFSVVEFEFGFRTYARNGFVRSVFMP